MVSLVGQTAAPACRTRTVMVPTSQGGWDIMSGEYYLQALAGTGTESQEFGPLVRHSDPGTSFGGH